MIRAVRHAFSIGGRTVTALLCVTIALASFRYLTDSPNRSPDILANTFARPFLVLHVAGGGMALLIGPLQFLARFRDRPLGLHRYIGRLYVICSLLGAIAGLPLAMGSTAGPVASAGFGTLGVCWFVTTLLGWRSAVCRRFAEHRAWMMRSWAMTFAAVTLRLYLPLAALMGFDFLTSYRAIAWLCWTGNLIVVEFYLRRTRPVRVSV